ncbi:MAG: hypothetical protein EOP82_19885 [Variovorax sp.]|nr:MAG: hypothetical protein EOP82_19885 [Variovorax sp.]
MTVASGVKQPAAAAKDAKTKAAEAKEKEAKAKEQKAKADKQAKLEAVSTQPAATGAAMPKLKP